MPNSDKHIYLLFYCGRVGGKGVPGGKDTGIGKGGGGRLDSEDLFVVAFRGETHRTRISRMSIADVLLVQARMGRCGPGLDGLH